MKYKRRFLRILRFALGLVLVLSVFAPQSFAPNPEALLVAYFVTWHATARGSGHHTYPNGEAFMKHFAEMHGSAVVRFEEHTTGGPLFVPHDTRYLSVVVTDSWQNSEVLHGELSRDRPDTYSISGNSFTDVVDPSENSGLYVRAGGNWEEQLLGDGSKPPNGPVIFRTAFTALGYLRFTYRTLGMSSQKCSPIGPNCRDSNLQDEQTYKGPIDGALLDPPAGLKAYEKWALAVQAASPEDNSLFSMNARFSNVINEPSSRLTTVVSGTDEVEWSAQARRLGTCPCAVNSVNPLASGLAWNTSPGTSRVNILATDQAIVNGQVKMVVDVWPYDHDIDPNGTIPNGKIAQIAGTPVRIRVTTCEGIPVWKAEVRVTVDAAKFSGWHNHDDPPSPPRPRGRLNGIEIVKDWGGGGEYCEWPPTGAKRCLVLWTDENGYAWDPSFKDNDTPKQTIKFQPPLAGKSPARYGAYESGVAGKYEIIVKTVRRKDNQIFFDSKASDSVTAAVEGLSTMPTTDPNYILVRDPKSVKTHPEGFYATAGTREKFKELAADFRHTQDNFNNLLKFCNQKWHFYPTSINDIALPTGGIFDWKHLNWHPSHQTHNKGEGGDFNRFGDIDDDEPAFVCVPSPPLGGQTVIAAPLRSLLLHTLLELGKKYGKWDCFDLGADVPEGPEIPISSEQCERGEFPEDLFPLAAGRTLHLHVQD